MMADVTANDVVVTPWQEPGAPTVELVQPGNPKLPNQATLSGVVQIHFPWIRALAMVVLKGTPGDDVSFWRFGFIQLGFIQEDWAHYRGDTAADGSVFVARDRPPALKQQTCRDSVAKTGIQGSFERFPFVGPIIFYDPETPITVSFWQPWNPRVTGFLPMGTRIPSGGKMVFGVTFGDSPSPHFWGLNRVNNTAQRVNNLYSLEYSRAVMTMFAVQKGPTQPVIVLQSFQWNVRWRAHFGFQGGQNVQLPARAGDVMDMNISHVVKGPPTDPRFRFATSDITLPNCNAQQQEAVAHQVVRESTKWEDWKVSH
jgi:hypothetical protein